MSELAWYEAFALARWLAWEHGFGPSDVETFLEAQRLLYTD